MRRKKSLILTLALIILFFALCSATTYRLDEDNEIEQENDDKSTSPASTLRTQDPDQYKRIESLLRMASDSGDDEKVVVSEDGSFNIFIDGEEFARLPKKTASQRIYKSEYSSQYTYTLKSDKNNKIRVQQSTIEDAGAIRLTRDISLKKPPQFEPNTIIKSDPANNKFAKKVRIEESDFENIKDWSFTTDKDGELIGGHFTPKEATDLTPIRIGGQTYELDVERDTRITFNYDKANNKITFNIDGRGTKDKFIYKDIAINVDEGEVEVYLDKEGKPKYLRVEKGSLGKKDHEKRDYSIGTEGKDLYIALTKEGFYEMREKFRGEEMKIDDVHQGLDGPRWAKRDKGALIYKGEDGLYMQGNVKANIHQLEYTSQGDTFTIFNERDKFFDVKEGSARIKNGGYQLTIEDGEAHLKKIRHEKKQDIPSQSFSFKHTTNTGEERIGYFDEEQSKYGYNNYEISLNKIGFKKNIGSDFLSQNDIGVNALAIEEQMSTIKEELKTKSLTRGQENSKRIELLRLKMQLKGLKGEDIDLNSYIEQTRRLIQGKKDISGNIIPNTGIPSNSKERAAGELFLGDLLIEKAKENGLPRLYSSKVRDRIRTNTLGEMHAYSEIETIYETIHFEESKGKVMGYWHNKEYYKLDEIAPGLADENIQRIKTLRQNDADISILKDDVSFNGYATSSSRFDDLKDYLGDARRYYASASLNAGSDTDLTGQADLKIATSYAISGENKKALSKMQKIYNDNSYTKDTRKDAILMSARMLFSENPRKNANKAYSLIRKAKEQTTEDSYDPEIEALKRSMTNYHLESHKISAGTEIEETNAEVNAMLGEYTGAKQDNRDKLWTAFHMFSAYYLPKKKEEILSKMNNNDNIATRTQIASQGLSRLNQNGVALSDFVTQEGHKQFFSLYEATGENSILTADTLERFITPKHFKNKESFEIALQDIEEEYGSDKAQQVKDAIKRVSLKKLMLDQAIRQDPTLHAIATEGKEIPGLEFEETTVLNEDNKEIKITKDMAFKQTRLGDHIGYTDTESWLLAAGDVVLNPMTYIGISGAMHSAKALGLFVGKEAGRELGQEMGLMALSKLNPQAGAVLGLTQLGRGGVGLTRAGFKKASNLAKRLKRSGTGSIKDLRFGVMGEVPTIAGKKADGTPLQEGDTFTRGGKNFEVMKKSDQKYLAELDGDEKRIVGLVADMKKDGPPQGFRQWDEGLESELRKNAFEANSEDMANRMQAINEKLESSRYVDDFKNRRVHPAEIDQSRATPDSTGMDKKYNGRFSEGELSTAEVSELSDNQRIAYAENLLRKENLLRAGEELTEYQRRAILAAHYTDIDKPLLDWQQAKYNILADAGLSKKQIKTGMDNWVMGDSKASKSLDAEELALRNDLLNDEVTIYNKQKAENYESIDPKIPPQIINKRIYSAHALYRMNERRIPNMVIEGILDSYDPKVSKEVMKIDLNVRSSDATGAASEIFIARKAAQMSPENLEAKWISLSPDYKAADYKPLLIFTSNNGKVVKTLFLVDNPAAISKKIKSEQLPDGITIDDIVTWAKQD